LPSRAPAAKRKTPADNAAAPATGLGLYITFQLTRIHNGDIQIGKRDDGRPGTCARISFPGTGDSTSTHNRKKSD